MKINNKKPNVFKYLFFFSILTPLLINCTRKSSETSAIKLAVPTQQFKTNSKTGSLATQKLTFAAANVRVKGDAKPFFSKNYNDNDTAATGTTSSIEWVVENPPAGKNLYIQVLAVYEDMTTEQEEINYTDTLVTLAPGEQTEVNLTLQAYSSIGKEGTLAGRILSSANSGPTGTLGLYLQPPTSTNPVDAMRIEGIEIWDGWFEAFAIDSADIGFTYKLEVPGQEDKVIFENLKLSSSYFNTAAKQNVAKIQIPKYFEYREEEGGAKERGNEEVVVGFFALPGSGVNVSSKKVCYSTRNEAIMRAYASNSTWDNLVYKHNGTVGTHITVSDGYPVTFGQMFTDTACNNSAIMQGNALRVYPQAIMSHEGGLIGRQGPFIRQHYSIDPWQGYMTRTHNTANTAITLKWTYLPGILTNSAVTSAEIYALLDNGTGGDNGGGDDHDTHCAEQAIERGYSKVGSTTTETYTYTTNVNSTNIHNWRFMICPYKTISTKKLYAQKTLDAQCSGYCENNNHFGWGVNDNLTMNGSFVTAGNVGGKSERVVAIDNSNAANAYTYDVLTLDNSGFTANEGDELLLLAVAGSDGSQPHCFTGTSGNTYPVGFYMSTRVLYSSGTTLKIPKGTFITDYVSPTVNHLTTNKQATQQFCWIQAMVIPHYKNVSLTGSLDADGNMNYTTFNSFIGFRANGLLTVNGRDITANSRGFIGSLTYGTSLQGDSTTSNYFGGEFSSLSSGGGGYGRGADSAPATGGQGWNNLSNSYNNGGPVLMAGSAGGGDNSTYNGGTGGGIVFVSAKKAALTAPFHFSANGGTPTSGGGGGGGSVNLNFGKLDIISFASSTVEAKGGDGTTSNGAGGGGLLQVNFCQDTDNELNELNTIINNDAGTGAVTTNSENGNIEVIRKPTADDDMGLWHCRELPPL